MDDYGELKSLSQDVRKILRSAGIGATERVAIVLPNGPEMAAAFVTVAQSATTAPLNPAYKEEEFAFYLEDLNARAIILEAGYQGPARSAAQRFDMSVIELHPAAKAGQFTLTTESTGAIETVSPKQMISL